MIRPNQDFRGYAGRVAGGVVECGAPVRILPSGKETVIKAIYVGEQVVTKAVAGQSSPSLSMANSTSRGVT